MTQDFACHYQIPLQELKENKQVEVMNERPIELGDITHNAKIGMKIQEHNEQLSMFIALLGHYPNVLGIPWLRLCNVAVRFGSNTVTFDSQYCITH
jgi:hypothetical protein